MAIGAGVAALNWPDPERPAAAEQRIDALEAPRGAAENAPADVDIRLAYGTALKHAGRDEQAHEQFAAAYRLRPLDADVAYVHASAQLADGNLMQAAATLDGLLELSPEHAPALLMRGAMLWQADDPQAAEILTRFLSVSPQDPAAQAVEEMLAATPQR